MCEFVGVFVVMDVYNLAAASEMLLLLLL